MLRLITLAGMVIHTLFLKCSGTIYNFYFHTAFAVFPKGIIYFYKWENFFPQSIEEGWEKNRKSLCTHYERCAKAFYHSRPWFADSCSLYFVYITSPKYIQCEVYNIALRMSVFSHKVCSDAFNRSSNLMAWQLPWFVL